MDDRLPDPASKHFYVPIVKKLLFMLF